MIHEKNLIDLQVIKMVLTTKLYELNLFLLDEILF